MSWRTESGISAVAKRAGWLMLNLIPSLSKIAVSMALVTRRKR